MRFDCVLWSGAYWKIKGIEKLSPKFGCGCLREVATYEKFAFVDLMRKFGVLENTTGGHTGWLDCNKHSPRRNLISILLGYEEVLLYLSVTARAVIGQFSGPYSTVRPAKI